MITYVSDKYEGNQHSFINDFLIGIISRTKVLEVTYKQKTRFRKLDRIFYTLTVLGKLYGLRSSEQIIIRNDTVLCWVASLIRKNIILHYSFPRDISGKKYKNIVRQLFLRLLLSRKIKIIVVSETSKRRLTELNSNAKILVIPLCPVNNLETEKDRGNAGKNFLYVGNMRKQRSIETLIEAMICVLDKTDRPRFELIGGTDAEIRYLKKKFQLNKYPKIILTTKIPRNELQEAFFRSDWGISMVPDSVINKEMSPTKLAEYISYSLPVLGSDNVIFQQEIISKYEIGILTKFSKSEITEAILKATSQERIDYDRMVDNVRSLKNNWNYGTYEAAFLEFIQA